MVICLEHFGQRQNFFDDKVAFSLEEPKGRALADNLQFNAEFAAFKGFEVNLSKKQKTLVSALKKGEVQSGILESDLKIKLDISKPLARKVIGFVNRGGFSQARGHGMAFGVICTD